MAKDMVRVWLSRTPDEDASSGVDVYIPLDADGCFRNVTEAVQALDEVTGGAVALVSFPDGRSFEVHHETSSVWKAL